MSNRVLKATNVDDDDHSNDITELDPEAWEEEVIETGGDDDSIETDSVPDLEPATR